MYLTQANPTSGWICPSLWHQFCASLSQEPAGKPGKKRGEVDMMLDRAEKILRVGWWAKSVRKTGTRLGHGVFRCQSCPGYRRTEVAWCSFTVFKKKRGKKSVVCLMLSGCVSLHLSGDVHIPAAPVSSQLPFDDQRTHSHNCTTHTQKGEQQETPFSTDLASDWLEHTRRNKFYP